MKTQRITYLSLGTNQGNKLKNLQDAIDLIADSIGFISKVASVYETASWGFDSNNFYNTCIEVSTHLPPDTLLSELLSIEKKLGRKRSISNGYSDRSIDVDIVLFGNEIIFSKSLIVPHPRMLERKFVLAPLAEIAGKVLHPIQKRILSDCLKKCNDNSEVKLLSDRLKYPVPFKGKYNYIAIEGNIGVGKTSLTNMMADQFNAKIVLEQFADNPFLPKFYQDNERYAFSLETSFLVDRYQQLSDDLGQLDLFRNFVISDYYIFKSLVFAQITLQNDELKLYRKIFDLMYKEIIKPDLYVYLYQNTKKLLENIKRRGREYEQNIKADYLQKIHDEYNRFINTHQQDLNMLIIDVSQFDFVNNLEDYLEVINLIKNH